jgi:hypothetical protein
MPLNYAQLDALTANATFLARVRQSLRFIAVYHRNNQDSTQPQRNWATALIDNGRVAEVASKMASELVTDGSVAAAADPTDPASLDDQTFKGAVEVYCFSYAP